MITKAIVFTGIEKVELHNIEMPAPGPDEVQIKTAYSTISAGTEGWVLKNKFTWSATQYPCVPGYQRVGKIIALGSDVNKWKIGEFVMATTGRWKSKVNSFWGAHIQVGNSHQNEVYHIPKGVELIDLSAAVVAQVGYNGASRAMLKPADWVVVYGDGTIGQFAAQSAKALGAKVILVGHRQERLELAKKFSADFVINNHDQDAVKSIKKIMDNNFANVVIDTVQTEETQNEYIDLLEYAKGQIVYSGFTPGKVWADMGLLQRMEVTAHFIAGWTRERMEGTLALFAQNKLKLQPLITHLVSYEKGPDMYRMILKKSEPFLGITLKWE